MFEKIKNKYCVVWFTDNSKELRPRKAKGFVSEVNDNFIELYDNLYGRIIINLKNIIKVSVLNQTETKGETKWKIQQ
jgi:hypothetical protein